MLAKILIAGISLYQKTLSPDHGVLKARYPYGFCRFYPSCSQYAKEALQTQPMYKAIPKSVWRIIRCNPFSRPRVDAVR